MFSHQAFALGIECTFFLHSSDVGKELHTSVPQTTKWIIIDLEVRFDLKVTAYKASFVCLLYLSA